MSNAEQPPRRERILSAAVAEFARHGYAGARMNRIAGMAKVNKQLLFHYFDSKAGLHDAALRRSFQRLAVDVPAGIPPVGRLRSLIDQVAAAAREHPTLLATLSGAASTAPSPEPAREWHRAAMRSAAAVLEDGQRSGHFRDDIDASEISQVVVSAALGLSAARSPDRPTDELDGPAATLVRMTMDHCAWR